MSSTEPVSPPTEAHPAVRSGRPVRVWVYRLLLVLGAVVAALAIGEILLRVCGLGPQLAAVSAGAFRMSSNQVLRYEFLPGAKYGDIRINSEGMADRPRMVEKPGHTFRIACIGDSICAGFQVRHTQTFAARLERLLNHHCQSTGRAFEVLNFGVTGYNMTQAVESLRVRGLRFDPDVIVYACCLNDVEDYSYEFECLRSHATAAELNFFDKVSGGGTRLARHSRLYALWRYSRERDTTAGNKRPATRPDLQFEHLAGNTYARYFARQYGSEEGWGRVTDGLTRLGEMAAERRVNAYVVLFPVLRDLEAYPLEGVHQQVADAARQRSLRVVDLLADYRALFREIGEEAKLDDLHPDATGHALAAVAILRELLAGEQLLAAGASLASVAGGDEPEAWVARLLLDRDGDADPVAPQLTSPGDG